MTIKELEAYAREFVKKNFDLDAIPNIKLSARIKNYFGHYSATKNEVVLSKDLILYNSRECVIDTLYHELIHYALRQLKIPNDDDDQEFIDKCNELDVALTKTHDFKVLNHIYECESCESRHYRRNKLSKKNAYYCRPCLDIERVSRMPYVGTKVMYTGNAKTYEQYLSEKNKTKELI